jgi:hypothetical protein
MAKSTPTGCYVNFRRSPSGGGAIKTTTTTTTTTTIASYCGSWNARGQVLPYRGFVWDQSFGRVEMTTTTKERESRKNNNNDNNNNAETIGLGPLS